MKKTSKNNLHRQLSFIASLGRSGMDFDLSRFRRFMARIGTPQNAFPAVHVAGTNGKGSVCALVASTLKTAGYKVGFYSSPHLIDLRERFQLNGQWISERDLIQQIRRVRAHLHKKNELTQFEFLTAIAFSWFREKNVDVAVVEVGLGGRLDATNVLSRVLVSAITTIDFDHTEWLGKTISKIAREKAGIIKPGVPVVTGAAGSALAIIRKVSRDKNAPLFVVSTGRSSRHQTTLKGRHQRFNAAIAELVCLRLNERGLLIRSSDIIAGFKSAVWPGRFEEIVVRRGRRSIHFILDGAHNPGGMKSFVRTLKDRGIRRVALLFGVLRDKDFRAMVRTVAPFVSDAKVVPVDSNRTAKPEEVVRLREWRKPPTRFSNAHEALLKIYEEGPREPVAVVGSLYLVGEVKKLLRI